MLNLPSTTAVNKKLPKEEFYRHLKLNAKTRDSFVKQVERIEIANTIKPTTLHVLDGEDVHEIFVMKLDLKEHGVPALMIEAIAKVNPHKILFRCVNGCTECYALYRSAKVWVSSWSDAESVAPLITHGDTLDEIWEAYSAQIIFGTTDIKDVSTEIKKRQKIATLDADIEKYERMIGKEKQIAKRNALFEKLQNAKRERASL